MKLQGPDLLHGVASSIDCHTRALQTSSVPPRRFWCKWLRSARHSFGSRGTGASGLRPASAKRGARWQQNKCVAAVRMRHLCDSVRPVFVSSRPVQNPRLGAAATDRRVTFLRKLPACSVPQRCSLMLWCAARNRATEWKVEQPEIMPTLPGRSTGALQTSVSQTCRSEIVCQLAYLASPPLVSRSGSTLHSNGQGVARSISWPRATGRSPSPDPVMTV